MAEFLQSRGVRPDYYRIFDNGKRDRCRQDDSKDRKGSACCQDRGEFNHSIVKIRLLMEREVVLWLPRWTAIILS